MAKTANEVAKTHVGKNQMQNLILMLILLISAQAALNKAKTSQKVIAKDNAQKRWSTVAEIVSILNSGTCHICFLWDEAARQYLGLFNGNTIWSEFQDPQYWTKIVDQGKTSQVFDLETRTQFWEIDAEGNEKAYMYDADLKEWMVRGVLVDDGIQAISWYTKPSADIPEKVLLSSGYDKTEYEKVVGDDGSRVPSYCAPGCPDYFIGDTYCDSACQNKECDKDAGD